MENEHLATQQLAAMLGGQAHEQEGVYSNNGPFPQPKPDVVVLPSGLQIRGTREALSMIYRFGFSDYLMHMAGAEEFAIETAERHIDALGDGTTVTDPITTPSPILLGFYQHPEKYRPNALL